MPGKTFTLTERTMLTADGQAVPAGQPGGVQLLGVAGRTIDYNLAVKVGLVKEDAAGVWPRHTGGGWYELSDGSKVKGKADAALAEKALHTPSGDKELKAEEDK